MFYDILKGMAGARRSGPVGDSSTLEQRTLTPLIMVRIQVPQPYNLVILVRFVSFRLRRNSSDMSAGYAPPSQWSTQNRGLGCAMARDVSRARFRAVTSSIVLDRRGVSRRKSEEPPLLLWGQD